MRRQQNLQFVGNLPYTVRPRLKEENLEGHLSLLSTSVTSLKSEQLQNTSSLFYIQSSGLLACLLPSFKASATLEQQVLVSGLGDCSNCGCPESKG